jgi:hypothetical protein
MTQNTPMAARQVEDAFERLYLGGEHRSFNAVERRFSYGKIMISAPGEHTILSGNVAVHDLGFR